MITITVITCTFNAEAEVERTLQSVKSQTYEHIEHLIIDGKSKDKTCEIINRYVSDCQNEHSKHTVNFISEPDKGLYDAMNKGIRLAKGDYLIYMNAGDTFHDENTIEKVVDSIDNVGLLPGVLYGDTDVVNEKGEFIRHRRLFPPENLTWRDFRNGMLVCHQSFFALTSIARANNYNNTKYRYSADVDWCIRVMKQSEAEGRKLQHTHCVVANFLDGGMTTINHRASLKERFAVMREHYGLFVTLRQHLWFVVRSIIKK